VGQPPAPARRLSKKAGSFGMFSGRAALAQHNEDAETTDGPEGVKVKTQGAPVGLSAYMKNFSKMAGGGSVAKKSNKR
jgi:hypothetical protein